MQLKRRELVIATIGVATGLSQAIAGHRAAPRRRKTKFVLLLAILLYTQPGLAQAAPVASSALQRANQIVLSILRQPPASGLAVISLELRPALVKSGLKPGDIISQVDGSPVRTIHQLRHAVRTAQTIGEKSLPILVARKNQIVRLFLPPTMPHVGLMPVTAGTAVSLGPIATAPEKFHWHLTQVPTVRPSRGQILGHHSWYLLMRNDEVIGALHLGIWRHASRWRVEWNQQTVHPGPLQAARWNIALRSAGGLTAKPWWLKTLLWTQPGRTVRARLLADTLKLHIPAAGGTGAMKLTTTRQMLIPSPAIALLAAAMPHRAGVVVHLAELSAGTLATRLNCSLETVGIRPLNMDGLTAKKCWQVNLLRFSVVQETFFFASDGTLLAMQLPHGVQAVHVASHAVVRQIIPANRISSLPRPAPAQLTH